MMLDATHAAELHELLAEQRRAQLESATRLERLERLVMALTGEDPITREVAKAPEGLRGLLTYLVQNGGRAGYSALCHELQCSAHSLGQRRGRTELGRRLILEEPSADEWGWDYLLRPEQVAPIRAGLGI